MSRFKPAVNHFHITASSSFTNHNKSFMKESDKAPTTEMTNSPGYSPLTQPVHSSFSMNVFWYNQEIVTRTNLAQSRAHDCTGRCEHLGHSRTAFWALSAYNYHSALREGNASSVTQKVPEKSGPTKFKNSKETVTTQKPHIPTRIPLDRFPGS